MQIGDIIDDSSLGAVIAQRGTDEKTCRRRPVASPFSFKLGGMFQTQVKNNPCGQSAFRGQSFWKIRQRKKSSSGGSTQRAKLKARRHPSSVTAVTKRQLLWDF